MSNPTRSSPTALIVDDDTAVRQMLEDVLASYGFVVTSFSHGKPALNALRDRRFNVLILDMWLPDMNGMSICELARETYHGNVTILMISADTRYQLAVTALQLCADDFMGKPFDVEELVGRIEARLRNRERAVGA